MIETLAHLGTKRSLVHSMGVLISLLAIAALAALGWPPSAAGPVLASAAPAAPAPPTEHSAGLAHTLATTYYIDLPLIQGDGSTAVPPERLASLNLYLQQYLAYTGIPIGWTGNHAACNRGDTNQQFRAAVLARINYFRTMAGLPSVTLNSEYSQKAQAAALMMSVNRKLSHSPTSDWLCYSSDGAAAAGSSDLALGVMGWNAITVFVLEGGVVGHRRWILYPQTQEMGTGDIPSAQGYPAANALWVFDSHMWEARPATRYEFVAWPPPTYVPYQVINNHWSFSYPDADFSSATVTMTSGGANIPVSLEAVVNGYGENTLVWIPAGLGSGSSWPKPQNDTIYTVNVRQVIVDGQSRNFAYSVIVFDPTPP
jgi:hypothetical protein